MALIKSNRDQCVFTEDGFIYLFDKLSADSLKRFCDVLKRINEHTHDSEAAKVEATVAINRLKNRAAETVEPTSTVINECISRLSEAAKDMEKYFIYKVKEVKLYDEKLIEIQTKILFHSTKQPSPTHYLLKFKFIEECLIVATHASLRQYIVTAAVKPVECNTLTSVIVELEYDGVAGYGVTSCHHPDQHLEL
ncbi:hypothetical protein AGLY_006853 [Aphis glycines]|uniref:Uncharacterized protein n=1 Tax=Aphis glycines TaxID=307491 RepID=A0A6G0TQ05_APHGL|nr:hypothetical protein AGLY_006853 [Aphis glycines]